MFPILLAIVLAWGVAAICTATGFFPEGHAAYVSTDNLAAAPWFRLPYPLQWGMPVFGAAAAYLASGTLPRDMRRVLETHGLPGSALTV